MKNKKKSLDPGVKLKLFKTCFIHLLIPHPLPTRVQTISTKSFENFLPIQVIHLHMCFC